MVRRFLQPWRSLAWLSRRPVVIGMFLLGAACLLSGILGAGVKVGDNELPAPQFLWQRLVVGAFGGVTILLSVILRESGAEGGLPGGEQTNRGLMIEKVRAFWIDGVLSHSLSEVVRIDLGLDTRPSLVVNPWELVVQDTDTAALRVAPGTSINELFQKAGQELLIAGPAGSGKTTLALELTRDRLALAETTTAIPFPVVFSLSSWRKGLRLEDWLVEELSRRYFVAPAIGRRWIGSHEMWPVLDGLDEVAAGDRPECVREVNAFHRRHGLLPLVVCSRTDEYEAVKQGLELRAAVVLRPLGREQAETVLGRLGERGTGLLESLRQDPTLWQLLDTPLMLNVFTLADRRASPGVPAQEATLEQRRAQLFSAYVDAMLKRRARRTRYPHERTVGYLSWLARTLEEMAQTVFYLDLLRKTLLPSTRLWQVVRAAAAVVATASTVLFSYLVIGWFSTRVAIIVGLLLAYVVGPVTWSSWSVDEEIEGTTEWRFSLRRLREFSLDDIFGGAVAGIVYAFITAPFVAVVFGIIAGLLGGPRVGLTTAWVAALVVLAIWILGFGGAAFLDQLLEAKEVTQREGVRFTDGQPIDKTLRLALRRGLLAGLLIGLVISLAKGWESGLPIALFAAVYLTLVQGGGSYLQHLLLRALLALHGCTPWRYVEFLDYAAERVLLYKVGDGYTFTHGLVREYLANLDLGCSPSGRKSIPSARS